MTLTDFTIRVCAAFLVGSVIGLERQFRLKMAGLRTNALVATGTALFVMITPLVGGSNLNATQIPAYVISGIGFLAGGVIFKERASVTGLNTAATMWCTAALGALIGIGNISYALIGVFAVLVANVVLRPLARLINERTFTTTELSVSYEIRAICKQDVEQKIREIMITAVRAAHVRLYAVSSTDYQDDLEEVIAVVSMSGNPDIKLEKIVSRIGIEDGVSVVSWKNVPHTPEESELTVED